MMLNNKTTKTMTKLGSNDITLKKVKEILGENTFDLQKLCTSEHINKYSFWKPCNINKVGRITESDIYGANVGFDLSNTYSNCFDMIAHIVNSNYDCWGYVRPEHYFRLEDFRNYDHNAIQPFILSFQGSNKESAGYNLYLNMSNDPHELLNYAVANNFSGANADKIYFGLLIASSFSTTQTSVYYYMVNNMMDFNFDEPRFAIKIPSELALGTYQILPVLTTYRDLNQQAGTAIYLNQRYDQNGFWTMYPPTLSNGKPISLEVVTEDDSPTYMHRNPIYSLTKNNMSFNHFTYNYNTALMTLSEIEGEMEINYETQLQGSANFSVELEAMVIFGSKSYSLSTGTITLSKTTTSAVFSIHYKDTINLVIEGKELEDEMPLRIYVSCTYGGNTYHPRYSTKDNTNGKYYIGIIAQRTSK